MRRKLSAKMSGFPGAHGSRNVAVDEPMKYSALCSSWATSYLLHSDVMQQKVSQEKKQATVLYKNAEATSDRECLCMSSFIN